jgi:hypothetical protein
MYFDKLHKLLDRAANLSEEKAWIVSVDNGVQKRIIELNTIDQLFNKGIDALGQSLGDYSQVSVEVFGKRAGHITLRDTTEFYNSFVVLVLKDRLIIRANTIKNDPIKGTTDLTDRFGEEIIGLTTENIEKISEIILVNIIEYVKRQLRI